MKNVTIVDRSDMINKLQASLVLRPQESAIVAVDMHRGHLDMDVATMPATPEDAARVIAGAQDALRFARSLSIPIIHVVLTYRMIPGLGSESMTQPFWRAMSEIKDAEDRLTPDDQARHRTTTLRAVAGQRSFRNSFKVPIM